MNRFIWLADKTVFSVHRTSNETKTRNKHTKYVVNITVYKWMDTALQWFQWRRCFTDRFPFQSSFFDGVLFRFLLRRPFWHEWNAHIYHFANDWWHFRQSRTERRKTPMNWSFNCVCLFVCIFATNIVHHFAWQNIWQFNFQMGHK